MPDYIYGIRNHRTGEIHRDNLTAEQAHGFMDHAEWDCIDPTDLFEIVRRPIGDWEPAREEEN